VNEDDDDQQRRDAEFLGAVRDVLRGQPFGVAPHLGFVRQDDARFLLPARPHNASHHRTSGRQTIDLVFIVGVIYIYMYI